MLCHYCQSISKLVSEEAPEFVETQYTTFEDVESRANDGCATCRILLQAEKPYVFKSKDSVAMDNSNAHSDGTLTVVWKMDGNHLTSGLWDWGRKNPSITASRARKLEASPEEAPTFVTWSRGEILTTKRTIFRCLSDCPVYLTAP
jgi:hypothetical protein